MPPEHRRRVPGRDAGVPGFAHQRAAADSRRAGHRLHHPRRALRELHPPDHDPFHAAVGGRRRAAGADAVPQRPERHRADRHHPAHRHRAEERDHDGRLRALRRSASRPRAERGDLPGVPAPFPPHSHDHARGDVRRPAAGARHGHRLGTAPAARHRHRRRPDRQPAPDALHHAGDLSRASAGSGSGGRAAARSATTTATSCPS